MKPFVTIVLLILSMNSFGQTNLSNDTTSTLNIEVRNKILIDSQNGGKLDFWTPIKGHEYDGKLIQKNPDIYASNKEIAVIKWAYNLTKAGIKKGDIISLYEELKGRKIRNDEITLIDLGIKKTSD